MRKVLVLGVAAVALIAFSGMAAGSVYMQYWEVLNSHGWDAGTQVGAYTLKGRYNYNDHMVWKEFDGVVYIPTHENWHINWDCKILDGNKPVTITHYNFMWIQKFTPTQDSLKYMGYIHIVDPQASNIDITGEFTGVQYYCWYPGLTPVITKIKDQRRVFATVDDTVELTSWFFDNFDMTLIPLIDRIEFGGMSIEMSLL